jgi:1-acyl-sn-glycerol-3-phosphate acyltransferase
MAGTTDCETRDGWYLEQDVNAWSSLVYVAAGAVLVAQVVRGRLPRAALGLATAVAFEGVGSWLYHGAVSDGSQLVHDVALIAGLGFVAGWHVGRLFGRSDAGSIVGLVTGGAGAAAQWAVAPGATNVMVAAMIAMIVAASLVARRRGLAAVWSPALLVLVTAAAATWWLGTPNSPACEPDSLLQPHAVWHALSALVVIAWADRAYAAARPDRAPLMFRRFADRTIGLLAIGLVYGFYRSVEVAWRDRRPTDRPVLIVANHGNGFVDPVVVASVLGRLPRFLAKAVLWKVPVARPLLALAGVLPVYRAADGDRSSDNASVFAACHTELAAGATVAIFPEGTTGDRAGLDRVKSGAARIALGSLPTSPDLVIVPIGLAYESKVETRSRVAVMFAEPIEVASFAGAGLDTSGEPHHADAAALTDRITVALQSVSPGFATVEEREILRAAAAVERAQTKGRPGFAEVEVTARRLAASSEGVRGTVIDAYRVFAGRLELIGISSDQLTGGRWPIRRLVVSAIAVALAGPLLVTVTLIHLPAVTIVVIGTGLVRSTATKGTVRVLLGAATMLLTWTIAGILLGDGWGAAGWAVLVAILGAAALAVWPPVWRAGVAILGRLKVRDRVGLLPPVLEARSDLVDAVRSGTGSTT